MRKENTTWMEGIYIYCSGEVIWQNAPPKVKAESRLCFRPQYYSLKLSYRTLSRTKCLRLIAKRVTKSSGRGPEGIDGYCYRQGGLIVVVVVRSPHQSVVENFLKNMKKVKGVCVDENSSVNTTIDYGVLHNQFIVNPSNVEREDNEDSFDNDDDANSSKHSYLSMYT